MKIATVILFLPLALEASDLIRIENKGVMNFNTKGASVRCQGETKITHPDFKIHSKGQLVQFYAASLSLPDRDVRPRDIKVHTQPASIVAIGNVTITLTHVMPHASVRCKKAVFIHDTGRWLIDGKAWPEDDPKSPSSEQ